MTPWPRGTLSCLINQPMRIVFEFLWSSPDSDDPLSLHTLILIDQIPSWFLLCYTIWSSFYILDFLHLLFNFSLQTPSAIPRKKNKGAFNKWTKLLQSIDFCFSLSWNNCCFLLPCHFIIFLEMVVRYVYYMSGESLLGLYTNSFFSSSIS